MKVLRVKNINDCFESTNVRDAIVDSPINKKFIDYLGKMGKLIYENSLEKPYFKVIVRAKYTIKGSQGNKTIRMMFPENAGDEYVDEIVDYINRFKKIDN
ncbi:MAG: hypothetical protein A2X61_02050 [Ignavibacteria bacterium GWB2_35_12]|nr:MAG: hypothetical protein A2X63_02215 [Ignavibacteria bacterium GWA2_35_8]OGU40033.1 MAG: hypothetical protein A2X61_02050 [Ignavibacteria bacterium GWB2_35_12]OGU86911.1 MAG: hypothetical protein A2220_12285 [Ignavibacteria bacterium RIFOXYA2_FULL_35_10]OGV21953.1 MAG: hypothetical protein A2475_07970 [Ignavibacteria bacterium RIFOXYC2_FULL_35_21]